MMRPFYMFSLACLHACGDDATRQPDALSLDGSVCPSEPAEGCPCDQHFDDACCTGVGVGLSCGLVLVAVDRYEYRWGTFYDCGCIAGPPCEAWELYDLCPGRD